VIPLGRWNKDKHIEWIKENPTKKPEKKSEKL
jgi:hypothetical protein